MLSGGVKQFLQLAEFIGDFVQTLVCLFFCEPESFFRVTFGEFHLAAGFHFARQFHQLSLLHPGFPKPQRNGQPLAW